MLMLIFLKLVYINCDNFFSLGFDRLPPGANPLDPHLIEMQRRYVQSLGQAGLPPGHIPGVYPPASLASDLLARERERIERLGKLCLFYIFTEL